LTFFLNHSILCTITNHKENFQKLPEQLVVPPTAYKNFVQNKLARFSQDNMTQICYIMAKETHKQQHYFANYLRYNRLHSLKK